MRHWRWKVTPCRMYRILVEWEPSTRLPEVLGDRVQLQQVILNLITNAIHAMAAESEPRVLRVTSAVDGASGVLVSVADSGSGIDLPDFDRIFNPLFTTKTDGMGMGLSICRVIIEAHEGRLGRFRILRGARCFISRCRAMVRPSMFEWNLQCCGHPHQFGQRSCPHLFHDLPAMNLQSDLTDP